MTYPRDEFGKEIRPKAKRNELGQCIKNDGAVIVGRGAPGKYKKSYHPKEYVELRRAGLTQAQVLAKFGIHKKTLYFWRDTYIEMSEAIMLGAVLAQAHYEDKLHRHMHPESDSDLLNKEQLNALFTILSRGFKDDWAEKSDPKNVEVNLQTVTTDEIKAQLAALSVKTTH